MSSASPPLHPVPYSIGKAVKATKIDRGGTGGWGWAAFNYNAAARTFSPGTTADVPPQGNDAKCGLGCHTIVKSRDYVFTDYQSR